MGQFQVRTTKALLGCSHSMFHPYPLQQSLWAIHPYPDYFCVDLKVPDQTLSPTPAINKSVSMSLTSSLNIPLAFLLQLKLGYFLMAHVLPWPFKVTASCLSKCPTFYPPFLTTSGPFPLLPLKHKPITSTTSTLTDFLATLLAFLKISEPRSLSSQVTFHHYFCHHPWSLYMGES